MNLKKTNDLEDKVDVSVCNTESFDSNQKTENEEYLTKSIINYLGNKRNLLKFIDQSTEYIKE